MNKISIFLGVLFLTIGFSSCFEDKEVILSEDTSAVARYANVQTGFYDFADINNASIAFDLSTVGTVDANSVVIMKSLNGSDPIEHTVVTNLPSTITISAADAADGFDGGVDGLELGDVFTYTFAVNTADGRKLPTGSLSLSTTVSCPSTLAGTYTSTTTGTSTDPCCPDETTVTSEVTITELGGGNYTISDFSAGLYLEWYDEYGIVAESDSPGEFNDNCNVITIQNTVEPFNTDVTGSGSVDADTGVITFTWVNGYDDTATVVLTPQ